MPFFIKFFFLNNHFNLTFFFVKILNNSKLELKNIKVYANIFIFLKLTFVKKYLFFFEKIYKYKSYIFLKKSSKFFISFFTKISSLLTDFLNNDFMFYIFSKNNYLNNFFNVKFSTLLVKLKKKNKVLIFMKYFFFLKKIKLVFFVNSDNLRFLFLFKHLNVKKVGFTSNFKKHNNFDFFLKIFDIDPLKEFYITHFIFDIFLKNIHKKYLNFYFKFLKNIHKKSIYLSNK